MDLIALAIPFFILALLAELAWDRYKRTGYYRLNDAMNSLSAGILSTTFGYFTKLFPAFIWTYVFESFALFDISLTWFDLSVRGLSYWLIALLAYDFCYYWAHRLGHEVSVLWAAHAVHHQSEDYNLSTALRQTSTGFLFRWVFYLPLFFLGMPFEVFAVVSAIDLIYQFWVHTQHIGRLGWLDYVLVTPSNHRVHHAQNPIYLDRNYGGILVIWDRLFGTFQEELDREPVIYGVRKPLRSWNPFKANLQVYQYLWFDAVRTADWRDKLGIWFRRTGWRPADMETKVPKRFHDLASFRKFDPDVEPGMHRYLLVQYTFVVALVLWTGILYAASGLQAIVIPCIFLWITLYSIGALSEGKPHGQRMEFFRLVFLMPMAVIAAAPWTSRPLAFGMTLFAIISLFLLPRPKDAQVLT